MVSLDIVILDRSNYSLGYWINGTITALYGMRAESQIIWYPPGVACIQSNARDWRLL